MTPTPREAAALPGDQLAQWIVDRVEGPTSSRMRAGLLDDIEAALGYRDHARATPTPREAADRPPYGGGRILLEAGDAVDVVEYDTEHVEVSRRRATVKHTKAADGQSMWQTPLGVFLDDRARTTTPSDDRGRELAEVSYSVLGEYLCEHDPDHCTCAPFEGQHEPHCGWTPIAYAENVRRALASSRTETEARDDARPGHWITEEFARARARFEQLPPGARPVVTPVEAQRAAASPPAPETEAGDPEVKRIVEEVRDDLRKRQDRARGESDEFGIPGVRLGPGILGTLADQLSDVLARLAASPPPPEGEAPGFPYTPNYEACASEQCGTVWSGPSPRPTICPECGGPAIGASPEGEAGDLGQSIRRHGDAISAACWELRQGADSAEIAQRIAAAAANVAVHYCAGVAASPPAPEGEAGEARTTLGEPETRFGWHDEDYQGHNPAVGWDLAFGCQVSIGYDDGTLRAVVAMSDASGRGHEVRTVTEEQVRAYASQLLALVTPAPGEGAGETESGDDLAGWVRVAARTVRQGGILTRTERGLIDRVLGQAAERLDVSHAPASPQAEGASEAADGDVVVDAVMTEPGVPDWGGEMTDQGTPIHHQAWDSDDDDLRLWVGPQHGELDSGWSISLNGRGLDVTLHADPDRILRWTDGVRRAIAISRADAGVAPAGPQAEGEGGER